MRNDDDYSLDDVRAAVAEANGYTLEQIMALDFPAPDYEASKAPFWFLDTVTGWLHSFRTALTLSERAHNPERFEEFARVIRALIREQT